MSNNLNKAIQKMYAAREKSDKEQQSFITAMMSQQTINNSMRASNKKASEDLEDLLKRI